jgi:hypothetical protein
LRARQAPPVNFPAFSLLCFQRISSAFVSEQMQV